MTKVLSEAEATAQLEQLEQEYGLWSLRVSGFSPWRIMRFAVGLELQNLPFQANGLPRGVLLKACMRSAWDMVRLRGRHRYAVKSFASALRVKTKEGYEDAYFEQLLQKVPGGLRLYNLNAVGYSGRPLAWAGPNVDTTLILVMGTLLARVFPLRDSGQAFERIAQAIGSRIPRDRFPAMRIRRMFSSFWWQSVLYGWLLQHSGVKTVFVADTGERALLRAARENGCAFIELQHGIFTPNHPDALPRAPGLEGSDPALLLPDIVAAYGVLWADAHRHRLLGACGRVRPAGASFIEVLRSLRQQSRPTGEVMRLLVTTQGLAREALIELLSDFLVTCPEQLRLDIKLHPAFDPSPAPYLDALGGDHRVNVIPGNAEPNTHRLLAGCTLHMSISSACHYDALGLQVPTLVLALPNHEVVLDLVVTGQALLVSNAQQLVKIVSGKAWIPVPAKLAEDYYKVGFVDNLSEWMAAS